MTKGATETELLIKETAKNIFFAKGHIQATTQEIAAEAGVNRALINYYFRSRDILFEKVLDETMAELHHKIEGIFSSDDSLFEKVNRFVDTFIDQNIGYPYLENFLITEMVKNPEKIKRFQPHDEQREGIKTLIGNQLEEEIAAGLMAPITMEHFMVNLMSLCSYPLLAKPMVQGLFAFDEKAYRAFLLERKHVVLQTIFKQAAL